MRIFRGNFDFKRIRKHRDFGKLIVQLYQSKTPDDIYNILAWIKSCKKIKIYRFELFNEMMRSICRARDLKKTVYDSSLEVRMMANKQKFYNFRFLSSTTLLSKGLEFDCVIIDCDTNKSVSDSRYSCTEMYVAMTRAMKEIYFITDDNVISLDPPKGVL